MTTTNYMVIAGVIFTLFAIATAMYYRIAEEVRILRIETRWQRVQIDILRHAVIRHREQKKKTIEEELKEFFNNLENYSPDAED